MCAPARPPPPRSLTISAPGRRSIRPASAAACGWRSMTRTAIVAGGLRRCPPHGEVHSLHPMKILIVEDDKEAAAYLKKALLEAGHAVDHASGVREGLF